MSPLKVAVAGASGNAGIPIINELLVAGYHVTALSRLGSNNSAKLPKHLELGVAEVDYDSVASLSRALQGHVAVVAVFGVAIPIGSQNALIDASVAAGVTRFFPAEFGTDTDNPRCISLSVFANKIQALDYLKAKVATNPGFSYTALCPGVFLDWGLGGRLHLVGVLAHLDDTKNRHVYIHDMVVSQNHLIATAQKLDGKDWYLTHVRSAAVETEALAELKKDKPDISKGLFPLLEISALGEGYGGDFSAHLDNQLLGIKGMNDEDLRALMVTYL